MFHTNLLNVGLTVNKKTKRNIKGEWEKIGSPKLTR